MNPMDCPAVFCVSSHGSEVSLVLKLNAPAPLVLRYMKFITWNSAPALNVWLPRIHVRLVFPVGRNEKIESAGLPPGVPRPNRWMPPWPVQGGGVERFGDGPVTHSPLAKVGNLPVSKVPFKPIEAGSKLPADGAL